MVLNASAGLPAGAAPASETIARILRGPEGPRFFGDGPPTRQQGRRLNPPKTSAQAAREQRHLVNALRRDGGDEALDLADALDRCTRRRPCLSGACPCCGRAMQRAFVHATRAHRQAAPGRAHLGHVVYVRAAVNRGALDADDVFETTRRRVLSALADCGVPAFGGLDISLNTHEDDDFEPYWCPHAHFFVPSEFIARLSDRFYRWFPQDRLTRVPVRFDPFDGDPAGHAYALMADFFRRESYEPPMFRDGSRSRFSTRLKPIWRDDRVELALALDRTGLDARLLLRGFALVRRGDHVELVRVQSRSSRPTRSEHEQGWGDRATRRR